MNITTANSGTYELIRTLAGKGPGPRRFPTPLILALIGAILMCYSSYAQGVETDKAAHFGVSSTINFAAYGVYKSLGMPRGPAMWFATTTTAIGCIAKEAGDREGDEGDLWADGLGLLTSNLLIWHFEF